MPLAPNLIDETLELDTDAQPLRMGDLFDAFERGLKEAEAEGAKDKSHPHAAERQDFFAFLQSILRDKRGAALPFSAYNRLLADCLTFAHARRLHLGHMAPPGISKSTTIRAFLCWLLGNDPTLATVVISAEEKVSRRQVAVSRKLILSKEYRAIFPEVEPDLNRGDFKRAEAGEAQGWTIKEFFFRNAHQSPDPAMAADCAAPKSEARRVNVLFADDLMSRAVADSTAMREEIIESANDTWQEGRLSEDGWMVATHNCWTKNDYLHTKLDDTRFLSLWVGVQEDCGKLFALVKNAPPDFPLLVSPELYSAERIAAPAGWDHAFTLPLPQGRANWTQEFLQAKRDNPAGRATFRKLFRLIAAAPEDLIFPSYPARKTEPKTVAQMLGTGDANGIPIFSKRDFQSRFMFAGGLDISGDGRRGNSLHFYAKDVSGRKYPVFHARSSSIEFILNLVEACWQNGLKFYRLRVENNGVQTTIIELMNVLGRVQEYEWKFRLDPFHTGTQKMHPEQGLPAIDALYAGGEIIWPTEESRRTDSPFAADWRSWEAEHETLTREAIFKTGGTPDSIMSEWFAIKDLDGCVDASVGKSEGIIRQSKIMRDF